MPDSAQYSVLLPLVNERIQSLVRGRLLEGLKFFDKNTLRHEYSRSEAKLALLIVKIANPDEQFTAAERQLMEVSQREISALKGEISALKQENSAPTKNRKKRV